MGNSKHLDEYEITPQSIYQNYVEQIKKAHPDSFDNRFVSLVGKLPLKDSPNCVAYSHEMADDNTKKFIYTKDDRKLSKEILDKKNTNIDIIQMDDLVKQKPNLSKTRLRTNWPFNNPTEEKANNNDVIWWVLYERFWRYGFEGADTIQQASFLLNNEKKNAFDPIEPRIFLRDHGEKIMWMHPGEWLDQNKTDVESCFVSVSRKITQEKITIFNPDGNVEYEKARNELNKNNVFLIFRTGAFEELMKLLKNDCRIHPDFLKKPYWEWKRNQWPKGPIVNNIYTVNNDGQLVLSEKNKNCKADDGYKLSYRVVKFLQRRKYQDNWTTICPPDKTFADQSYLEFKNQQDAESKLSLVKSFVFRYIECFGRYSRTATKGNTKFQPNMPLNQIWNDDKIIDYWNIPSKLIDRMYKDMENYKRWFKHFEGL